MPNQWAIMDNDGVIDQGSEEKIKEYWRNSDARYYRYRMGEAEVERFSVHGDLRLIEIHEVKK